MNNNKPIWKDYPLQVSGGTYVIKEYVGGSWVTRRTFHALANPRGNADVCVNNMLCNDLKTGYPSVTGVTTHSDAWRRYECQTGATTGTTEAFNFCQDWSWEDWDGEQRTLSCPINGHADMRQRLFRSRFGELSENIEIKALIRPNFSYNYVDSVAANTTSGYITVTANEEFSISCDASWITGLSDARGDVGEQTFLFSIDSYTGFTDRSTTIEVTYLGYDGEYVTDELPLTQRAIIPFFNVSPTALTISWESGTTYVNVNTNVPFAVSDNQSWIEYASMSQVGADSWNVFFNVSANTGDSREAVLTFTYQTGEAISGTTTASVRQTTIPIVGGRIYYTASPAQLLTPSVTEGFGATYLGSYNDETGYYWEFESSPTAIPDAAFMGLAPLKTVSAPVTVTSIGNSAFTSTELTTITASGVTTIGNCAFEYDKNLSYVEFGNVVSIGDNAFLSCSALTSIDLTNIQHLGEAAFYKCKVLSNVEIGTGITFIPNTCFGYCSGMTSMDIPEGVTEIGQRVFYYANNISAVTLPSTLVKMGSNQGYGTFWCAFGLSSLTIPNSVEEIYGEFIGKTSVSSITIPDSVEILEGGFLDSTTSLAHLTIGARIIPKSQTNGVDWHLSSLTITTAVTEIKDYAFESAIRGDTVINYTGTKAQWAQVKKGLTWAGAYGCDLFIHCTDGDVGTKEPAMTYTRNNSSYISPRGSAACYTLSQSGNTFTLSGQGGKWSIPDNGFSGYTGLDSADLFGIVKIGKKAYSGCTSLSSVTIGASVKTIDNDAFRDCTSLTTINYADTIVEWGYITKGSNWHYNAPVTVVHCTDGDINLS